MENKTRKTINMTLSASGTRVGIHVEETGQYLYRDTDPETVIQDAIALAKLNVSVDLMQTDICLTFPANVEMEGIFDDEDDDLPFPFKHISMPDVRGKTITFRRNKPFSGFHLEVAE